MQLAGIYHAVWNAREQLALAQNAYAQLASKQMSKEEAYATLDLALLQISNQAHYIKQTANAARW